MSSTTCPECSSKDVAPPVADDPVNLCEGCGKEWVEVSVEERLCHLAGLPEPEVLPEDQEVKEAWFAHFVDELERLAIAEVRVPYEVWKASSPLEREALTRARESKRSREIECLVTLLTEKLSGLVTIPDKWQEHANKLVQEMVK